MPFVKVYDRGRSALFSVYARGHGSPDRKAQFPVNHQLSAMAALVVPTQPPLGVMVAVRRAGVGNLSDRGHRVTVQVAV